MQTEKAFDNEWLTSRLIAMAMYNSLIIMPKEVAVIKERGETEAELEVDLREVHLKPVAVGQVLGRELLVRGRREKERGETEVWWSTCPYLGCCTVGN